MEIFKNIFNNILSYFLTNLPLVSSYFGKRNCFFLFNLNIRISIIRWRICPNEFQEIPCYPISPPICSWMFCVSNKTLIIR